MFGHRLELIPFFLYLKQHLFLGFKKLDVQLLLQIDEIFEIFIIGLSKL